MTSAVDQLLAEARRGLERLTPAQAQAVAEAGGLVVDIRPGELRARDGVIPDALVVDRNQMEWRLDPSSTHRHPAVAADDHDRAVVLVCDEGFASSLAAATLQRLGLGRATDMIGGFQAWRTAGLPVSDGSATGG